MTEPVKLQSLTLRAAKKAVDYQVYRSALEWDLTDPIVIESREDVKSVVRWKDRLEPFNHQVSNLITFCRRLPVTLLADDVGLGKTISAGLVMSELMSRSRLSKTLIVAPKILGTQWKEELSTKFDIQSEVVVGRDLLNDTDEQTGAVITTYHSAREYLDRLPPDRFQMLILDEAHKLRNLYGTDKAPQVALRFRAALAERRFPFVLMLTATPIQNRLWDLYSLIDLLTVARGHNNPFGSDGQFARKFIEGDREQARHLKSETAQEFRSIVYGYMSRIRRQDAQLHFPDRKVQLHRVDPTAKELELIGLVGRGIAKLNKLAQISILQALTSSPQALQAQLDNMARNQTVSVTFAGDIRTLVKSMTTSAKLNGLGALIETLKKENPESWRLVVFTIRRETQTTIQIFLESHGLSVGLINGASGSRNQETIAGFKSNPPKTRVIVSTEAGSEGVNLQVANVLVNYDLPWNPMIVEQRIGRIQRLKSEHASVAIFNITLRGTFEEYIVGRLMEKLQMATSAIGDIESLLEGLGIASDDEDGFEEKLRLLVVAALQGADVENSTRLIERSIAEAKAKLVEEEKSINEMLGEDTGQSYAGPRSPELPPPQRSMSLQDFTLQAFNNLGAKVAHEGNGIYEVVENGARQLIHFGPSKPDLAGLSLYAAGTPPFSRLVRRILSSGVHSVKDLDIDTRRITDQMARTWVAGFGGVTEGVDLKDARLNLQGSIIVRARATVAHDSYERLIEIPCARCGSARFFPDALASLPHTIEGPDVLGLYTPEIVNAAHEDQALMEFARFYSERRAYEVSAAGDDVHKRKKMEDDFTPRFTFVLAGAEGCLKRDVRTTVTYRIGQSAALESTLTISPSKSAVISEPVRGICALSKTSVPEVALGECAITKTRVLTHLLAISEHSGRRSLPEHSVKCEQSGTRLLSDEVARSAVSGRWIGKHLLKESRVSGLSAEAEHFALCEFSRIEALKSELCVSEISGKAFRADASVQSSVSSLVGHRSEFIACHHTGAYIAITEAELCSVTGKRVGPGILQICEETGCRALPSEMSQSAISGKKVLRKLLVQSSISHLYALSSETIRSSRGSFCTPLEAKKCFWSGRLSHPDDSRTCVLTGLEINFEYSSASSSRLDLLQKLLEGTVRKTDAQEKWEQIAFHAQKAIGKGRVRIEAAFLSPTKQHIAITTEVKTMLGFRTKLVGFIYSQDYDSIIGAIATGSRNGNNWRAD